MASSYTSDVGDFHLIPKGQVIKVRNILDIEDGKFWDVLYYRGQFYAINYLGELKTYRLGSDNTITVEQVSQFPLPRWLPKSYLVESGGVMLMVVQERFPHLDRSREAKQPTRTGNSFQCLAIDSMEVEDTELRVIRSFSTVRDGEASNSRGRQAMVSPGMDSPAGPDVWAFCIGFLGSS
ncbi:hypothetical protein Patl1_18847 [Pistacia atlantica]|uniref:Uncharacterized protein n=1 Tax=Pistacia atlantica TaxID=434234 RepID=A0ACC1C1N8_9ROSI|nr:hypothetical protein Patl1_18847 [Pistacia atlantica]